MLPRQDASFIKGLELLALRRLHSFHVDQISHIVKAYALMLQQGKIYVASITFLQSFEAILQGKCNQFTHNVGGLAQALTALVKIYKLTSNSPEGAMVSKEILVGLTEQLLSEIEIMVGDDEEVTATHA